MPPKPTTSTEAPTPKVPVTPNEFGLILSRPRVTAHTKYHINDRADMDRLKAITKEIKTLNEAKADGFEATVEKLKQEKKTISEKVVRIGGGSNLVLTHLLENVVRDIIKHTDADSPVTSSTLGVENCFCPGSEKYPFIAFVRTLPEYTLNQVHETAVSDQKKADTQHKKEIAAKIKELEVKLAAEGKTAEDIKKATAEARKALTADDDDDSDEDGNLSSFESYIRHIYTHMHETGVFTKTPSGEDRHKFSARYFEFLSEIVAACISRVASTLRSMVTSGKNRTLTTEDILQYTHMIMIHENFPADVRATFDSTVQGALKYSEERELKAAEEKKNKLTDEDKKKLSTQNDEKQKKKDAAEAAKLEKRLATDAAKLAKLKATATVVA
jgi:hypothetical protein